MAGYLDVLEAWFGGQKTEEMILGGSPMYLWGRWGKILLYIAGFSVILDIIDHSKLPERAEKADERSRLAKGEARRRREISRVIRLQNKSLKNSYGMCQETSGRLPGSSLGVKRRHPGMFR